MLAYAASRRRDLADRRPHPNTMLLIIGAHVAALAALMSAKMDLPNHFKSEPPIVVDTIRDSHRPRRTPALKSRSCNSRSGRRPINRLKI